MASIESTSNIVKSPRTVEYPNQSVPEYIAKKLSQLDQNLIALIDPKDDANQLTYGELNSQSHAFASALLSLGITNQDFVMFYSENNLQYVSAMLATIFLGLPFCPIPPASGPFELSEQITGSNGTVLVFASEKMKTIEKALNDPKYAEAMKRLKVVVQLQCMEVDDSLLKHPVLTGTKVYSFEKMLQTGVGKQLKSIPHFPILDLSTHHFLICYTSGTTGKAKGAIHTHRSFLTAMVNCTHQAQTPGGRLVVWHPIGHMSGSFIVLHCISAGQTIILFDHNDLEPLLQAVEKHKPKHFTFGPNHATLLANNDFEQKYDLSSLFAFSHGGSRIAKNLLLKIRAKYQVLLMDFYGSTEFLGGIGERSDISALMGDNFKAGDLGTCFPNVEMKVINLKTGKSLPANEEGEICLRGPCCFAGYLNNEEATKSTIVDGWYHSGDIGYYNEKGNLFITDRIKEMIKYKLYSLIPAEIEDFIHQHEAVAAVCVVGVPHVTDGNLIRAYVQIKEGKKVTEQELINYVAENMGFQKHLRAGVQFVNEVPRTLVGKLDRQHFKQMVANELITEQIP